MEIEKEEFEKLNNNLKKITTEEVRDLISLAVNKIMKDYGLIEYEKTYLENYKEILIKNSLDALKRDNLRTIIVVNEKNQNNENNLIIDEEKRMDDEEFRELIEEIISSDNIYEKITLINKKINANDLIEEGMQLVLDKYNKEVKING